MVTSPQETGLIKEPWGRGYRSRTGPGLAGKGKAAGARLPGRPKANVVGRGIGRVDDEAIESHGPHAAVEGPGCLGSPSGVDDLLGQEAQGAMPSRLRASHKVVHPSVAPQAEDWSHLKTWR